MLDSAYTLGLSHYQYHIQSLMWPRTRTILRLSRYHLGSRLRRY